jgi:hypothetical protein
MSADDRVTGTSGVQSAVDCVTVVHGVQSIVTVLSTGDPVTGVQSSESNLAVVGRANVETVDVELSGDEFSADAVPAVFRRGGDVEALRLIATVAGDADVILAEAGAVAVANVLDAAFVVGGGDVETV